MFTRQHFNAIAEVLETVSHIPVDDQRTQIGYALANLFQADNPNFDMQRFIDAANLPE